MLFRSVLFPFCLECFDFAHSRILPEGTIFQFQQVLLRLLRKARPSRAVQINVRAAALRLIVARSFGAFGEPEIDFSLVIPAGADNISLVIGIRRAKADVDAPS